jgi:predicted glycosyltransferase
VTARVLIYVQHLLGVGHLARMSRIAESLVMAGMRVTLVQGGAETGLKPSAGVEIARLAPVKVEAADMSVLLHADGKPFAEADKAARRDHLLGLLAVAQPDILLIEAFPFGRRQMRFELLPLLEAARAQGVAVIASSIRDILQESRKPGRAEETAALVERWFDLVLVHGDERLTPLALTFPLAERVAAKVRYTGLVGPPQPTRAEGGFAVVVSAGGGVVGAGLLRAAVAAAPLTRLAGKKWLILAGNNLPDVDFDGLRTLAAGMPAITIRRSVPDLPAHLRDATLSISQAGYNTVADVLAAGCRSVLVPFAAGGETEQATRADALAAAGRAVALAEDALTPAALAAAIDRAAAMPKPAPQAFDGGANTARALRSALDIATIANKQVETPRAMSSSPTVEKP